MDFGDGYDSDSSNAGPYCCGNRVFVAHMPTQKILDRYHITLGEYKEVCDKLVDGLSFGRCGWCS